MARAQVCRFYDDGTSGAALRRPIKRLPEFQTPQGLFYSAKARRLPTSHSQSFLLVPRSALLQAVLVFLALYFIFSNQLPNSPSVRSDSAAATSSTSTSSVKAFADSIGVGSGVAMFNALAEKTMGSANVSAHGSSIPLRISIPDEDVKQGVSLVAVCMGRQDTVKKTIPAWLKVKDVNEIVVIDWSSEPPLEPTIRAIPGADGVKIIRVNGEQSWVLSRAYNLAMNAAGYSHIIRTDCDYEVGEDFVAAHRTLMEHDTAAVGDTSTTAGQDVQRDGKRYYAGNYNLARNENEVHLNGAVFIRRKDFLEIGGYDERIQTYGWDDEDLYNRLGDAGLQKMNISYDHVSHVQHDNSGRAQSGVKFVAVEIDLNALLLEKLEPWQKNMNIATTYKQTSDSSANSNSIVVEAETRPKSLRDLVTQEQYDEAWNTALGRRLHDSYFVPWDIIAATSIKGKESLLRRLMYRTENRERQRRAELDAAGRQSEMVDVDSIPTPRILLCHCMHGLGNRLRALGSCMSFAKESSRELVVVWEPDSHIEAKFTDMYSNPLVVVEKMPVKWPFSEVEKWDSVWSQFKFHNYMEMEGMGAIKGEKIYDIPNKHIYYKGAYIMEADNEDLTNWEKDNAQLRSLEPINPVQEMVREIEAKGVGTENVIGLHVRNRTLEKDIKNVDFIKEYGGEATKTMDMWRQKSGVQNFIKLMDSIIKEKPGAKFFVATDTFEVIGQLEEMYPDRILSFKRTCDERDGECVRYAMADLYALAKCKELYGSNWSSFTEAAERIGGIKAKLAGQDFGV